MFQFETPSDWQLCLLKVQLKTVQMNFYLYQKTGDLIHISNVSTLLVMLALMFVFFLIELILHIVPLSQFYFVRCQSCGIRYFVG